MASNEVDVLDPAAAIEKLKKIGSGVAVNRRSFVAALGAAGAVAGASVVSAPSALAQQPTPNGFNQIDVLNYLLNIKYLLGTLYSYATQGSDFPASSGVGSGAGGVFNAPAKMTFSSQQITDLFNELYYDELNQLIALRSLLGNAAVSRQTVNVMGTGTVTVSGSSATPVTTTYTQSQFIALARMLEDLSVTAFAGAANYLTGTNLEYASEVLAADGFHAGALRLLSIQTGAQYQGTLYTDTATSSAATPVSVAGVLTTGSPVIYALGTLPAVLVDIPKTNPAVSLTGYGIPQGAGGVVKATSSKANATPTGITDGTNVINTVSSVSGVLPGQPITGTNIPANTYITNVGSNTITLSAKTTAATTVKPTGILTAGSNVISSVSSVSGVLKGQVISGTGIPANTTVTAVSSSSANPLTITVSNNATASSQATFTGTTTAGSAYVTNLTGFSSGTTIGSLVVGQPISGPGIPANTIIANVDTAKATIGLGNTTSTVSATATGSGSFTTPILVTLTTPTNETLTIGQSSVTLTGTASVTGINTVSVLFGDTMDVQPGDQGTPSAAASGPGFVTGTSPAMYQGFFNTAGSGTSSAANPAGLAFARTFAQVLSVLYNYNSSSSTTTTQTYQGGFYPYGVSGSINVVPSS